MSVSLSVVIMAFNEEANLPVQLDRALAYLAQRADDWEIVVVDDGSTDGTAEVVRRYARAHPGRVELVRHAENRGMGAAIRSGYGAARCRWVTQLPADCQVHPRVFDRFLPHLDEAAIVLSTYRRRDDGLGRRVLSAGYRTVMRALLGVRGDYTGTMVFRRELLDRLGPLHADSFFVNLELPIRALREGLPHAHVEIEASPRLYGRSKVANARKIATVLREAVAMRWREPPVRRPTTPMARPRRRG